MAGSVTIQIDVVGNSIVCDGDLLGDAKGRGSGASEIEWVLSARARRAGCTFSLQFIPRPLALPAVRGRGRGRVTRTWAKTVATAELVSCRPDRSTGWPFVGPAPPNFTTAPATRYVGRFDPGAAGRCYKYAITIFPHLLYLDPIVVVEP